MWKKTFATFASFTAVLSSSSWLGLHVDDERGFEHARRCWAKDWAFIVDFCAIIIERVFGGTDLAKASNSTFKRAAWFVHELSPVLLLLLESSVGRLSPPLLLLLLPLLLSESTLGILPVSFMLSAGAFFVRIEKCWLATRAVSTCQPPFNSAIKRCVTFSSSSTIVCVNEAPEECLPMKKRIRHNFAA